QPHFITTPDSATRQLNSFWLVRFKDQTKSASVRQLTDFGLKVPGKLCIGLTNLTQQIGQPRHRCLSPLYVHALRAVLFISAMVASLFILSFQDGTKPR